MMIQFITVIYIEKLVPGYIIEIVVLTMFHISLAVMYQDVMGL
jgi:hypothetical protein